MDIEKYYEKLLTKIKDENSLPYERSLRHRYEENKKDNYISFSVKNFVYGFLVSPLSKKSVYGDNFEGFVIYLYIKGDYFETYFNQLQKQKNNIEKELNVNNVIWQPKEDTDSKNVCRIYAKYEAKIEDESRWDEYIDWQIDTMIKFLKVLPKYTNELKKNGENNMIETKIVYTEEVEPSLYNKTKNIILYGVPGVGKTYSTKKLISLLEMKQKEKDIFLKIEENSFNNNEEANQLVENIKDRVKFITFHQSFSYEDFIEGFRPNKDGHIELKKGVFRKLCKKAKEDKENKYYLVIDEINRGNISKIFGELITLIEEDKRDSLHVALPYSKKSFSIPSNLYIVGTMNSTDKSIALIDIALRRRFTFIHMTPNPELVKYDKAKELMKKLNNKLPSEYQIGHSYFMKIKDEKDEKDLAFTCKYKIKPLLEEYFYGDEQGLNEVLELLKNET